MGRKKIMVPQAEKIEALQKENEELKQQNAELSEFKKKYDEQKYVYLQLHKLENAADKESAIKNVIDDEEEIEDMLMANVRTLSDWNKVTKELAHLFFELNE